MRRAILALAILGCGSEPEIRNEPADAALGDTHPHEAALDAPHREVAADAMDIPPPPVPETLAETGFPAEGMIAFDVRYPLWSDGAEKSRFLWLPPGAKIDTSNPDHWTYPKGTRAWKEFRVGGKKIETRFLEKTGEGGWGWRYVAYAWDADGKTARAAKNGVKNALGTSHDIPSQEHCDQCHSGTRDGVIGPGAYQWTGQLGTLGAIFTAAPRDVEPPGAGVVKEVLGYLHGNCGYCHSDFGRWADARKMRTKLRIADTDPATTPTYVTLINVKMSHDDKDGNPYIGIVPGDPGKSHLVMRMERRDGIWEMPPIGSEVVDTAAVARVREWITNMK